MFFLKQSLDAAVVLLQETKMRNRTACFWRRHGLFARNVLGEVRLLGLDLRQLKEKERYLERMIYLREIIDAKNKAVDECKADSLEDYNQLKRIDDSVDRKSLKHLRLMKKVLRNDDLTSEEKRVAIKEITDN